MTKDPSPDPPPLPFLPPDPVPPRPIGGPRTSPLSSPSSSPMDLFPEVSMVDPMASGVNQARQPQSPCGSSLPQSGSFIFGSLNPSVAIMSVPPVDATRVNHVLSTPAGGPFDASTQDLNPAGSPNVKCDKSSNPAPSSPAYNWASNLNSASKFPPPSAAVSMSAEGKPRVKIPNGVFERGAKIHSDYIVGIFYGKAPSYGKIWAVLNYLWGKDRRVTIHHLAKNAYIFYIPSPSLRKRILQHELWRVGDSPFFVTEWKAEFSLNPPSLDKAPVWVKIQGIPFDLITYEGLSSVCSPLGRVVDAKPFTSISSAEVKVIANLTKPLPSEIELECDDGNLLVLEITYPWLPPLCSICNEIGHKAALCPVSIVKEKSDNKGKSVATDTDPEKDWQTQSRKRNSKRSKKKQQGSEANSNTAGHSASNLVHVEKTNVSVEKTNVSCDPSQVDSSNKFHPLQEEEPESVSNIGSTMAKAQEGSVVLGTSVEGSSAQVNSLAVGFSLGPSSALGSHMPQSQSQPPSLALVVSAGKGLNSMASFCSSPKSSTERKKKKRKYSSPVHQGSSVKLEDGISIVYTVVYASNEEELRKDLWISLRDTSAAFDLANKPWIVGGDFNEILHPDETSNRGINTTTRAMRLFGECLGDLGLFDLPFTGPKYTWTNKRPSDPIGKKLDRCLVNGAWILQFPSSYCEFSAPEFSDHCPCHIQMISPPPSFGSRPFKFYNLLIRNSEFLEVVKESWISAGPRAFTLRTFCFKLKSMKRPMKTLHRENYSDIEKRVHLAEDKLNSAQLAALNDPTPSNVQMEVLAKDLWISLRLAEESFFRQRSRIKWLGEGDLNTPFYHGMMTMRNALNAVKQLFRDDGSVTTSLQEVHELALDYFEGFLCTVRGMFWPDLPDFLEALIQRKCSTQDRDACLLPFGPDLIVSCLQKMKNFEMMSGLAVNVSKTTLFSSGIAEDEIQRIADRFRLVRSNLPVRYLDGPTRLGVPLFTLVSDVWNGFSWSLPEARSNRQLELLSYLTTISPANMQDSSNWIVNRNPQTTFISRLVGEAIRPHLPAKPWAPLLWHKDVAILTVMASLKSPLPPAKSTTTTFHDHSNAPWFKNRFTESEKSSAAAFKAVPAYRKRQGYYPEDFGDDDGGA
ncbi:hypothetical protein HA466_0297770 [Hirschfeldia incana]|nr:hypothetical protein HA466_0297770 [Hirschfeldia incana]